MYFWKEEDLIFQKMYGFPWLLEAHSCGCSHDFPYFPQISQYVSTLFPNTESYIFIALSKQANNSHTLFSKRRAHWFWPVLLVNPSHVKFSEWSWEFWHGVYCELLSRPLDKIKMTRGRGQWTESQKNRVIFMCKTFGEECRLTLQNEGWIWLFSFVCVFYLHALNVSCICS